jgi:2-keto-4-pentenoate hydratase/2-oxohepta-3-ene-1,7-dioic acid hydratase in catechol pathway
LSSAAALIACARGAWDVFGITAVNDVTARDIQSKEVQYAPGLRHVRAIGPCAGRRDSVRAVEGW